MGSNIPRILDAWLEYPAATRKRTGIIRFAGIWIGLVFMVAGALLDRNQRLDGGGRR